MAPAKEDKLAELSTSL